MNSRNSMKVGTLTTPLLDADIPIGQIFIKSTIQFTTTVTYLTDFNFKIVNEFNENFSFTVSTSVYCSFYAVVSGVLQK